MVSGQKLNFSEKAPLAIDNNVGGEWRNSLELIREAIITWVIEKVGVDEVVKAKDEFFTRTGMIFHDDEYYHQRMKYFLDYFLFARVLESSEGNAPTPFALYKLEHPHTPIQNFTHSLFKVAKALKKGLVLSDLCSKDRIIIQKQSDELFDGMERGNIFQGFVFHIKGNPVLSHGLIFHPIRSHRILLKSLKDSKKNGDFERLSYLSRYARLQLKHGRLRHVDPRIVYADIQI